MTETLRKLLEISHPGVDARSMARFVSVLAFIVVIAPLNARAHMDRGQDRTIAHAYAPGDN